MNNLIEIGDFKLARENRGGRAPRSECGHRHLTLDDNGEVVRCADCQTQVSAYWALTMLADEYKRQWDRLMAAKQALAEEKAKDIHMLAAKEVEKAWRSRTMIPTCPHCHRGIFPHDGFGRELVNKALENRRRQVAAGREGIRQTAGEMSIKDRG